MMFYICMYDINVWIAQEKLKKKRRSRSEESDTICMIQTASYLYFWYCIWISHNNKEGEKFHKQRRVWYILRFFLTQFAWYMLLYICIYDTIFFTYVMITKKVWYIWYSLKLWYSLLYIYIYEILFEFLKNNQRGRWISKAKKSLTIWDFFLYLWYMLFICISMIRCLDFSRTIKKGKVKFQKRREVWYICDPTCSKIYFDIVCIYDTWYFTYVSIYKDWIVQNNRRRWEDSEVNERKFRSRL